MEFVDSAGKPLITLGVFPSNKRLFPLTSEIEIMRGDLVRIVYDDSMKHASAAARSGDQYPRLQYKFNTTITDIVQSGERVQARFSDERTHTFDLVVGADGQRSRTRRLAFGSQVDDNAFKSLGVQAAYFTIPRLQGKSSLARMCVEPGHGLLTRTGDRPVTGANIFATLDQERLRNSYRLPVEEQKQAWCDRIQSATWQVERFREGLRDCDDFYAHEQGQIKIPILYSGRVVLLGDAGYCPSPFTGLGTTLALGGAYTLAGEITRHSNDLKRGLSAYQSKMKPLIDECQQLNPGGPGIFFPTSYLGVWILQITARFMSVLQLDKLMSRWMAASNDRGSGWVAEDYPPLNLGDA